jgi:hypothetical protein
MEKKFVITITKTAIVPLISEFEAESLARLITERESTETMAGNLMFVTTDIKEMEYA